MPLRPANASVRALQRHAALGRAPEARQRPGRQRIDPLRDPALRLRQGGAIDTHLVVRMRPGNFRRLVEKPPEAHRNAQLGVLAARSLISAQ